MHVIAAGLYGLLRQDRWVEKGGSIERWLAQHVRRRVRVRILTLVLLVTAPMSSEGLSELCVA